jgi:hypothetical protein
MGSSQVVLATARHPANAAMQRRCMPQNTMAIRKLMVIWHVAPLLQT